MLETLSSICLRYEKKDRLFLFPTFYAHLSERARVLSDGAGLIALRNYSIIGVKVSIEALDSFLACKLRILHFILLSVITPSKSI